MKTILFFIFIMYTSSSFAASIYLVKFDGDSHTIIKRVDYKSHAPIHKQKIKTFYSKVMLSYQIGSQVRRISITDPRVIRAPLDPVTNKHGQHIIREQGFYTFKTNDDLVKMEKIKLHFNNTIEVLIDDTLY